MDSSPVAGWSGAPRMSERKRRGRNVDIVLPTPPRTRQPVQLPTPETGRRHSKHPSVIKPVAPVASTSQLPTPETVSRKSRRKAQTAEPNEAAQLPSPSGHTTFFLSQPTHTRETSGGSRRRPGLTFNQQMGLNNASTSESTTFGGRLGVGVGMGGHRNPGHKVDQIVFEPHLDALRIQATDDNPFLVPSSAPGPSTQHVPTIVEPQSDNASPRFKRRRIVPTPKINFDPVNSAMSLLSPPLTQRTQRIAPVTPPKAETQAKRIREERIRKMMDEDSNPFLVKPGQHVIHRPGPVVDEDRSTVTYVFRGAKKVFANPFIGAETRIHQSELDVEDEEYEAHPCPKPKLLWPTRTPPKQTSTPQTPRNQRAARRSGRTAESDISPPSSPMPTPHVEYPGNEAFSDEEFLPEHEAEGFEEESMEDADELPVKRGLLFGSASTSGPTHTQDRPQKRSRVSR